MLEVRRASRYRETTSGQTLRGQTEARRLIAQTKLPNRITPRPSAGAFLMVAPVSRRTRGTARHPASCPGWGSPRRSARPRPADRHRNRMSAHRGSPDHHQTVLSQPQHAATGPALDGKRHRVGREPAGLPARARERPGAVHATVYRDDAGYYTHITRALRRLSFNPGRAAGGCAPRGVAVAGLGGSPLGPNVRGVKLVHYVRVHRNRARPRAMLYCARLKPNGRELLSGGSDVVSHNATHNTKPFRYLAMP